ncbi:MAG: UshA-like (seleno)protein [Deltaproteobacteria bacterium]
MGGLSKKAYQLKELRKETSAPILTLDGGALLFDEMPLPPAQEAPAKATARGIVKAYNLMGYDAVGVSRYDLAGGLPFLRRMAKDSKFRWLSANLMDQADHKPLFLPRLIKKVGSLTVGVIGLTGTGGPPPADGVILPWREALPAVVTELEPKTDFIILLADIDRQQIEEITATLPAINLIIQTRGNGTNQPPELVHQSLICRTAKQGKYLGMLSLDWQGRPDWGRRPAAVLLDRKRALDRLNWQLRHLPKTAALQEEKKGLAEEIATLESDKDKISSFQNRFLAMESSVPDEPKVEAVVSEIRQEINRLGRQAAQQRAGAAGGDHSYVGWQACARCHPLETKNWQKTKHAGSYRTLTVKKQQFNLNCLPCHVTGIQKETAAALALSEGRRTVGCEMCHGPGGKHAQAPKRNQVRRRPAAEVCLRCHTPEQDDDFDFQRDLKRAAHPE